MKIYAGVGSRKTPTPVLETMIRLGQYLAMDGWILRSGGAIGADLAFEKGCDIANGKKEIYLAKDANEEARRIAASVHPYWFSLKPYARDLIARNGFQVLGEDLKTPCLFVLCWTPDGAEQFTTRETGGTGQAIRLAVKYSIPVVNMRRDGWRERLQAILSEAQE